MFKKLILILCAFVLTCLSGFAIESIRFEDFIADNAHVISEQKENELNTLLLDLQNKTKADIAVVTLNSLENRPIEDVSLEIGRKYKLGDKKLNNGAVILVAPNDKKARIEIGYGLEGVITDAHAGRILDDYMIPHFKENNYEQGIVDGTKVLAIDIAKGYGTEISVGAPQKPNNYNDGVTWLDVLISIIILTLFFIFGFGFFAFPHIKISPI